MRRACLASLCLTALCIPPATPGADAQRQAPGTTHTVIIENMQFNPPRLQVRPGERIVWVNRDLFPHTVTAVSRAFDSGSIAPNASWTYLARKPGEYAYGCTFHPSMKATLEVK